MSFRRPGVQALPGNGSPPTAWKCARKHGLAQSLPGVNWHTQSAGELPRPGSNWTVKASKRSPPRRISSPNIVPANAAAPLPPDMEENLYGEGDASPLAEMQAELRKMWRTTPMNRYYLPISQMPPLRPDPRVKLGRGPPSFYVDLSVSRVQRLTQRWQSMPQLRRQLPQEVLDEIDASGREKAGDGWDSDDSSSLSSSLDALTPPRSAPSAASRADGPKPQACGSCARRQRGVGLHVPCTCCKHREPKPWEKRKPLSEASRALLAKAGAT
mmetsp:Transcript_54057/g.106754  ORF Transcript_54057/g.106754 Transcript_54057/m.106754 type:complete len:271 (-) Transcript_54057:41-853(-)